MSYLRRRRKQLGVVEAVATSKIRLPPEILKAALTCSWLICSGHNKNPTKALRGHAVDVGRARLSNRKII